MSSNIKKSMLTLSNFNDLQDDFIIDLKHKCYTINFPLTEIDTPQYQFLLEVSTLLSDYKPKKRKKIKYKNKWNKPYKKIRDLKQKSKKAKKVNIILNHDVNPKKEIYKLAKELYSEG
jgi:hypothetical protein